MIPIDEMTYGDYLDLERAWMHRNKKLIRQMIGTADAITVLIELEEKFEGNNGHDQ